MPSYYDMWAEFDNANYINEVPVSIEYDKDGNCLIDNQQTIVYDEDKGAFVNDYVAVGGGGGQAVQFFQGGEFFRGEITFRTYVEGKGVRGQIFLPPAHGG